MTENACILAIDQGTTSSRAIAFDRSGAMLAMAQRELPQIYPANGLVEHDPEQIWASALSTAREVVAKVGLGAVAAIGITNQRETTILWERATGRPIHNAIVWQDRRGAALCRRLSHDGHDCVIRAQTGLMVDSYFSATKLAWLLDHVPGAREQAEAGELAFGTVDCFLLWRLTGGHIHATDATNAARTMLFDIHRQGWSHELLALFDIPAAILPEVLDCSAAFGHADAALFGRAIPIAGMAGDQHAAMIGQACFHPGMVKSTYGTGCFALANTGAKALPSKNRLLATPAYRLEGRVTYALEGSIFNAGSTVKWLRDMIGIIGSAAETERLAEALDSNRGVYFVPAFTGLGAPHWDADARGAIFGLTRDTGIAELVRAALEAVCFQTADLIDAMVADGIPAPDILRVDGGMAVNTWLMQFLADILGVRVERPRITETTALGAAFLAGLHVGMWQGLDDVENVWASQAGFSPRMAKAEQTRLLHDWRDAVGRVRVRPAFGV